MNPAQKLSAFIILLVALSVPFWIAGALSGSLLLPGLPISAFMVVAPAAAALILTARNEGRVVAWQLLLRIFDVRRVSGTILALALVTMPALTLSAWVWMMIDGVPMPTTEFSAASAARLLIVFWIAGAAEELGWSGYLAEPTQRLWGFLGAGLGVGLIWALWHVVPLLQAGRGWTWIAWWTLATIASRVVALAFYRWSNKSVFAVSVLHAAQNTAWQCFPDQYDPGYAAPLFLAAATLCSGLILAMPQRQ